MTKLNDNSNLSINIKWLIQIVLGVGTAVYMYLQLENRIKEVEGDTKGIRHNQNVYVFPDIRVLESEILQWKLERERLRKDIKRINEIIKK
jgi:hypothetical protein